MLLVSLVLVNVVIAVLLDAFGKASAEGEPSKVPVEQDEGEGEDIRQEKCPFGESAPGHRFFFKTGFVLEDSSGQQLTL